MEESNKGVVAVLALLGAAGGYWLYSKNKSKAQELPPNGMTFDPGMDADTQTAINNALMKETNPTNLRQLALGCRAKGYTKAAAALEAKAAAIDAANSPLPGNVPSVPVNTSNSTTPVSPKDLPAAIATVIEQAAAANIGATPLDTPAVANADPATGLKVMTVPQLLADKALEAPMTILQVQQALNVLLPGVNLVEDGVNGPKTTNAVKSYQVHKHLSVDGIPGPQTWKSIRQDLLELGKV
jgi:lysozyme family protein